MTDLSSLRVKEAGTDYISISKFLTCSRISSYAILQEKSLDYVTWGLLYLSCFHLNNHADFILGVDCLPPPTHPVQLVVGKGLL